MKTENHCEYCGALLTKSSQTRYCSNECAKKHQFKEKCEAVEKSGVFPQSGRFNETDRRFVRRFLISKYGNICSICGNSFWNNKPIPLVADHIDGNSCNHNISNLRLICPNCDAQLPTYKSRNLSSDTYVPGDRSERHSEEYDRKLERFGFTRCEPKKRATGICLECGKEFDKKHLSQKYCSRICADKNRTNQWTRNK